MTYSIDFRKKVLKVRKEEGLSYADISKRFAVGLASIVRWSKRIEPCRTRHKAPTRIKTEALREDVILYPDAYHYERARRLGVSTRGIGDALKRLGVTYKKNAQASQSRCRKAIYVLPKAPSL